MLPLCDPVRVAGAILALMLGHSATATPVPVTPGVSLQLAEQRSALISDIHYRLYFDIPEALDAPIPARADIRFDLKDASEGLQLDFRESPDKICAVLVNGAGAHYRFEQEHILLDSAALIAGRNRVEIEFIADSTSLNRNPEYLYTLFVPDQARTAFPLFDQPDLKATWELTLVTPADWIAVSNSPLDKTNRHGDRTEHRFAPSKKISSYLFSFVAGKFQAVNRTVDGRSMTLFHRETDTAKVERNLDAIFEIHGNALAWLEEYTGIANPFEKFDFVLTPSFQYGGMEHPGAILYRASYLLLEADPPQPKLLRRACDNTCRISPSKTLPGPTWCIYLMRNPTRIWPPGAASGWILQGDRNSVWRRSAGGPSWSTATKTCWRASWVIPGITCISSSIFCRPNRINCC
jgi:aminopeptidase N